MGDLSRREMSAVVWLRKVKMIFVLQERGLTERLVDMKRTTMLSCENCPRLWHRVKPDNISNAYKSSRNREVMNTTY